MKYIFSFLMALTGIAACGQSLSEAMEKKIGVIFEQYDNKTAPGCAVLIVKEGRIVFSKGYGMANLEDGVPVTPATVFDIASVSKQFTGYAISTLIGEGRISANDEIHKYLPDVPQFASPVTIRNLIHHTSGLRDWPATLHAAGWRWDESFRYEDILRMVGQQKDLDFPAGTEYQYSNTGYNLLAAIVAKVSGETFPVWISEHIFQPLGMKDSRVLVDPSEVIPHLACSYRREGESYHKSTDQLTAWGSSSIFTTVEDLAKWVSFFQRGLDSKDPVILRMVETDTLTNGQPVGYGYGLEVSNDKGMRNISHTGGWASFATIISNYPDAHLSIILLSNSGGFDPGDKAGKVAAILLNRGEAAGPVQEDLGKRPTVPVDSQLLKKYLGVYQLGPNWFVRFTLENGNMMAQANGEGKFWADMKSDSVLWVPGYGSTVTFLDVRDRANAIRYHGKVAPRVEPLDTNGRVLSDYSGTYYSPELEVTYVLSVRSGKLMMHHMRLGDGDIDPDIVTRDAFSSPVGIMRFTRDGRGVVNGFSLSAGRPRNIRFEKQ